MGLCGAAKGPPPKLCHTYSRLMKPSTVIPYLKKTQEEYNQMTLSLSSSYISIFHWKSVIFVISRWSQLNSVSGVGSVSTWVAWVRGFLGGVD